MDILKNFNVNQEMASDPTMAMNNAGADAVTMSPEHEAMLQSVGSMMDEAKKSDLLTCDSECQRERREQVLYDEYIRAQQVEETAPELLEQAERNYYEFSKGSEEYNKIREKHYEKEANTHIAKLRSQYEQKIKETSQLYNHYKTQQSYLNTTNNTKKMYREKIKETKGRIDDLNNKRNIHNRLDYYVNQKSDVAELISYVMTIIYYVLVVAFGVTFIILNNQFTNKKLWALTTVLLLLPTGFSFVFNQVKVYL